MTHGNDGTGGEAIRGQQGARRLALWLGAGVTLMVALTIGAFVLARGCTPPPPPKLVIAKETTWFTGPLFADGTIDWPGALRAEAVAAGFDEAGNGAASMVKALDLLTAENQWFEMRGGFADPETAREAATKAMEALLAHRLDAPHVELLRKWLAECGPAFEAAREAAAAPHWFACGPDKPLWVISFADRGAKVFWLRRAMRLEVAAAIASGDAERALDIASVALRLARRRATPTGAMERAFTMEAEVEIVAQLAAGTRAVPPLPATRALQCIETVGEEDVTAALAEVARAERLFVTSSMDFVRSWTNPNGVSGMDEGEKRQLLGFHASDQNPLFREVQEEFDSLTAELTAPGQPLERRLAAALDRLDRWKEAGKPLPPQRMGPLGALMLSNEQLAELFVDRLRGRQAEYASDRLREWLAATARRDALIAEIAARAGAPPRVDSLLGQPLRVTLQPDGSADVTGELLEVAARIVPDFHR